MSDDVLARTFGGTVKQISSGASSSNDTPFAGSAACGHPSRGCVSVHVGSNGHSPYDTAPYIERVWDTTILQRTCSGVLKRTNPRQVTAARRTSSLTSETATCNNRRIALLLEVPQYAIPMAYMAPYRKMGSRSRESCSIIPSAASS